MPPIDLTLAHSPDPDDVFMWWPLTGKIAPPAETDPFAHADWRPSPPLAPPVLNTSPFRFAALPADIEALNRRATEIGDLDITALSVRAWADVQDRYAITACGASFGDGFGPKLVCRADHSTIGCYNCLKAEDIRIAIPGRRTTAFLMLGLVLGRHAMARDDRFIEMPFDQIIPAVARGQADAGLVIHEGQLTFADAGLRLILDVGQWWKQRTGLKLPLGINAVRRDLDDRHGPGTLGRLSQLLRDSVAYSMARWDESVRYTMPFAAANAARAGAAPPTLERVDQYCRMYVSEETRDMGEQGRQAIYRLLSEAAAAGLCPAVERIDLL
jgi:1,4-dihydroxy-6-naphthoate synthase